MKAGVKNSGKPTPWATQEVWNGVGRRLGVPCVVDDVGEPCLPGLLYTRLHGERAVERYTADMPRMGDGTSTRQSSSAYLYSAYTVLYTIQLYSL